MNHKLKKDINTLSDAEIRALLRNDSFSVKDKKVAEKELLNRDSYLRKNEKNHNPLEVKWWIILLVILIMCKVTIHLVKRFH